MNRFRQIILLLLFLFVLPSSLFASSSPEQKVTLTNEEQAFLLAHPEIKLGIGEDWTPYVIRQPSGELEGFEVDMLAHINAVTGANIKLVAGPWKKTVEQAERHELDGLALTVANRDRGERFLFSDSYISTYPAFVVSSNYPENIEQIDNLNGKTVAILSGHKFYQTLLSAYPQITILEKPSEPEVVRSIITGEATAAIVATTSLDKHFKNFGRSIRLAYIATDRPLSVLYSIRKDWPELVEIINKGLSLLPVEQFNRSYYRWFGMESPLIDTLNRPVFSDAEKAWLEQKHLVRVHIGNYMPYYSTDTNHEAQGMCVDYLNLVAKRSGMQLKYDSSNSWSEALSAIREHRDIDLLPAAYITAERTKYLNFTTEYLQSPSVIFTRDDSPQISSLDDLVGKTIAVEKGYATTKWLAEKYPKVKQLTEETTTDALRALSSGKVDAFVGNLTVLMYISRTQGFTNLKVAAPSPFNADTQAMAIRGDWPELAGIINKTLETLTPEEHETIRSRWLPPVQYEYGDNQAEIVKWVGGVGGILFIVIMVVVFWNKKLSEEITARKQSEEQLKNSEEKFRSITELSHVGIFLNDSEGKAIYINSRCAEIIGAPTEEALSLDWVQYLHPDDRDRVVNEWLKAVANKKPFKQEYRYVHSDGQVAWTLGETSPVLNSQGEVSLFIGTMVDITALKHAEKELQQNEALLRELFDNIEIGSAIYETLDDGQSFIIKELNRYGIEKGQVKKEDVIGCEVRDVFPGVVTLGLFEVFRDVWKTGQPKRHTSSLYQDDKITLWVENYVSRLPSGQLVAIYEDITDKRQSEIDKDALEKQLAQAQKIESIGQLAGGVAHDFNNMLGVILGHTELALMKADPENPFLRNLEEIKKAARHSADLTRQLLTFARKQTITPKVLDLNKFLAGMLQMLQRLIGENVQLSWVPAENLWSVKMDPSQLSQILTNLCVNARDAIGDIGKITIEAQNCSLGASDLASHADALPGDYVKLSVSDDGHGMEKDILAQIFEPFFTTKGLGQGTGLGLSTVFGAVKQNAGFIDVSSVPGQGTSVHIYLPRNEVIAVAAPAATTKPIRRGTETILLVEDDQMLLKLTQTMLEENGYSVLAAATIDRAISLAKDHEGPIHLLLSDLIMPEMNGKDLRHVLQAIRPDMKVIFMSGYTADIIAKQGVIEEAIHFLQKPVSFEALISKVQEVLGCD